VATAAGRSSKAATPTTRSTSIWSRAIRKDERLNEGWFGAVSSMTAVLGRMATYSGQVVRWDDAVAKGPDESPERLAWDAAPRHVPGPTAATLCNARRYQALLNRMKVISIFNHVAGACDARAFPARTRPAAFHIACMARSIA